MESPYDKIKDGFKQICKREVGLSHPRKFSRRFSSSQMLVEKVNLYGKLVGHQGCVNAVEFNSTGELLVSGSDDKQVIFWDWATTSKTLSYPSGHFDNIFQTKIMPFSADRKIVTSASDGQVRLGQVLENGRVDTKRLGKHQGRVYKLAVEPGSPHIVYSCGEDGLVQHFDLRSRSATRLFYCSSFAEHSKQPPSHIRLNGIVFDPRNPNYFAVGGSDAYARVYDLRNCQWNASNDSDRPINAFCPHHLCESNTVNITGLAFSCTSELLVSYNDELIYLFQKDMGRGSSPPEISASEVKKLEQPQVYVGHRNSETIKGVNFYGPNDEFVLSGSDCGHIFIWKKHGAKLVRVMHGDRHIVNQLEPHPHMPMFATCGIEKNVKLWVPMASEAPPLPENLETIIESNKQGREDSAQIILTPDVIMHVLRLQRRQMLAYAERSHNVSDTERHEEEEASYILGFPDSDDASEEGSESNPGECNID